MAGLTTKQKEELEFAIHEYLVKHKYLEVADLFAAAANVNLDAPKSNGSLSSSIKNNVLERKWTSIAKLMKDVEELKKQNQQLKDQGACEKCGGGQGGMIPAGNVGSNTSGDGLPREPEKFVLRGHKANITQVAMHPIYSDMASSSADGSIRLWDVEQGEETGSLRGHTAGVNYVVFHPNGQIIASCSSDCMIKLWNF
ncbi:MAG TPA: hypothetical protein VHA52_01470 [Candidatus Babeliaceae bacterium]|nr:hypothetical protein [Candidatus Babeliaceae bacterium]